MGSEELYCMVWTVLGNSVDPDYSFFLYRLENFFANSLLTGQVGFIRLDYLHNII